MTRVKLLQEWTDGESVTHPVDTVLDLDDAIATDLKEHEIAIDWVGMTGEVGATNVAPETTGYRPA